MGLDEAPLVPNAEALPSDVPFIVTGDKIDSLLPGYWQVHEQGTLRNFRHLNFRSLDCLFSPCRGQDPLVVA